MAKPNQIVTEQFTTEEKIKAAAKAVFYKKGFAATRTRDIAEEAGINLALLNYYFRSKQKLFELIMLETLTAFIEKMVLLLNDERTTLDQKVREVVENYIDVITAEPELPIFIITEIRSNPKLLLQKIPVKKIIRQSVFFKQHQKAVHEGRIQEPNPLHFLMNLIGMIVFPFMAKPLLMAGGGIEEKEFNELMKERKKLIPMWIKAIMKAK
ncbi:TetR/AcrR family transcriptional regulator [Niabella insulamsoli]|uniref:TetR/AcrR family transcriptional regulator n=1 Tax=Niabella insulamsoli TaxID=3144874 RepID=UPI0031FDA972